MTMQRGTQVNEVSGIFKNMRQHLMNGVSHMIPVVVSGGILFAVATMLSVGSITTSGAVTATNPVIDLLKQLGGIGLGLMVPVLSAFIADSIADRPGIAPGLICGQLAVNVGSGFIGGIIAGILAGIVAQELKRIRLPQAMQSLIPILIIPIVTTLVVGAIILYVVGGPCAWLLDTLTGWLTGMSGAGAILVGAITGAMIGFDLGGPVNKVAYSTGVAIVGTEVAAGANCAFFGPIALAIGLPPIALGIESFVFRSKFSDEERNAGIGAIIMGACGITEGAISYTTSDPGRLIPINVISCAVGGAVAGALGTYCNAAWGGLVILPVTSVATYVVSLAIGVATHMALVFLLKKEYVEEDTGEATTSDDLDIEIEF